MEIFSLSKRYWRAVLIILTASLFVVACSNTGKQELRTQADIRFQSKITHTGLKHFEVSVRNGSRTAYRIVNPTSHSNIKKRRQYSERKLERITEEKLKQVDYCSNGYWIMEIQTLTENLKVRGECNEVASKKDKENFPDTLSGW